MNESKLREDICRYGRSLFERGLTPGSSGNISVRLADGGWSDDSFRRLPELRHVLSILRQRYWRSSDVLVVLQTQLGAPSARVRDAVPE